MTINFTSFYKTLFIALFCSCFTTNLNAQINVKVQIISVSSNLDDCDYGVNIPFIGVVGDSGSDPLFSWSGSVVNNNCYAMPECNNTASPAGCTALGTIDVRNQNLYLYDENFACPTNFPLTIPWNFEGRENDTPTNCILGAPASVQSAIASASANVVIPGVANTFTQTYTNVTTSGCTGSFTYVVEVRVTGIFPPAVPDMICDAADIPVDGNFHNYAWCGGYTYETGEFDMTSPGWLVNAFGSGWFRFTAPASGSVAINTSGTQTTLGTAFIVYHAADGAGCSVAGSPGHGVSASGVTLKRKFQYLSSYDDADDDIYLIAPQGKADIDMNSCSNILSDGHDLVAGETYYIQMTTDRLTDIGNIGIRITNLGGGGSNATDIPCQAVNAGVLTTANWNHTNSYGCSTDYEFTGNTNGTSAYSYLDPLGGSNNVNQSSWVSFVAPTSGAAYAMTNVSVFGENNALYAYDARFAPGRPADYSCANLLQTNYSGSSAVFGGNAQFTARCLEPGYNYYVMGDPATVNLNLSSTLDFTLRDPGNIAPANDILCLAAQSPAFSVPVQLLNQPAPAAVSGDNTNACIERLAGEPGFQNAADKTVWHYFTAPPSGVVNVTVTALTIGQVAFATYHALNGTSCYGGLAPATFTNDGTPTTPRLTALATANGSGAVVSQVCCLTPGDRYFIEVDGGTTISEGTYNVRIQEVQVVAGATQYLDSDGDTYTISSPTPALICANETITASSAGAILPVGGCLEEGFILHNNPNPTLPYNFTIYQQATPTNHFFVNNGTVPYNQTVYVSALADNAATWGNRCPSARIKDAVPVVFLAPITFGTPVVTACGSVRVTVQGGLPLYDNSLFSFTISPSNQVSPVASGTVANGGFISFTGLQPGNYNVFVSDGEGCVRSKTINIPSIAIVTPSLTGATTFCANNPTTLTATGGNFYDWTQPDGTPNVGATISATQGGTYTVTVTNAAGCTASATHLLTALPAAPTPTISVISPLCTIGNAQLSATAGYTNYLWNNAQTTQNITTTTAGVYSVTATNTAGCTATTSISITTNTNPSAPTITGNTLICGNNFNTLDAGVGFATYNWSNTQNTQQIAVTTAGIYTVTVTNTAGCTTTATSSITAGATPTAPVISQTAPLCSNSNTSISAAGTYNSYLWNTNATTATIAIATGNAGVYTVTVSNAAGCTNTATYNIQQFAAPTTPVLVQQDSLCGNSNGTLAANGTGYTAYLWNNTATTPNISITTAGTYTVTVTNASGCQITNSLVVSSQAAPAITTIAQTGVLCNNSSLDLTANTATTGVSYLWNTGATTQSITVAAGSSGSFTVTVSTAAGCSITANATVNSQAAPAQPLITIDRNLCSNASGLISIPPTANTTYTWSGATTTTNILTITAAGIYTVTVTNTAGCTNTASTTIQQYQAPNPPTITMNPTFCSNQTAILTAYSPNNPTYQWSNIWSAASTPITLAGTYTVTVTNAFGCKNTKSITVSEQPAPIMQPFTQTGVLCSNSSASITASALGVVGPLAYSWNTGATSPNITIPANTTATYTVTITSLAGCSNSSQITVTAIPAPAPPLITVDRNLCSNLSGLISVPSISNTSYAWSGSTNFTNILSVTAAGTYTVTVTNTAGCTNTASTAIQQNQAPTTPTIVQSIPLCINKTTTITANGGYISYSWGTAGNGQAITVNTNGIYTVTVSNTNGCTNSATINVLQEAQTVATLQGNDYFCENGQTNLQTDTPFTSYIWNTNATTRGITVSTTGSYTVTVTAANGCTATVNVNVAERSLPNAYAGGNQAIYIGQSATLNASGGATYIWTPSTAFTNPTNSTQIVTPNQTTVYTVLVTDAYGCAKLDSAEITIYDYLECLKTDEGVTPNGDGINDVWAIPCIANFENTIEIYNRWGTLLYSATNYPQNWAGTSNGLPLPDGTYYYVVRIKTENPRKLYKGTITILR